MSEAVLAISKLFDRGKVVIPKEVRERLHVADGDKIVWIEDELVYIPIPF